MRPITREWLERQEERFGDDDNCTAGSPDELLAAASRSGPGRQAERGAAVLAAFFNVLPIGELQRVPSEVAEQVGGYLVGEGYRLVFNKWYLQDAPKESSPRREG